jgi:hypothetical protein
MPFQTIRNAQAAIAEEKQMGALLVGVEKVAHLVSRCSVYE